MFQQTIQKHFLSTLEHTEIGTIEVLTPEGKTYRFSGNQPGPHAHLALSDWSVIARLFSQGDIAFAEDYRDGRWESRDLAALIRFAFENDHALNRYIYGGSFFRALAWMAGLCARNTLKGSKRNIHAHYDIGNDFYRLWLDPSMTYSSALFADDDTPLTQAQHQKYDRILERLGDRPGRIIEVGCGWGGFAERAVTQNDHAVRGITLSKEQYAYAKQRLPHQAEFVLEDYRNQEGKYDYLVSIEMFEAVGERYWPTYFGKMASLLKSKGRAVIQTITIDHELFPSYRTGSDVIRKYIFPGGMLPSPERFHQEAHKAGLQMVDRFDFGKDYARTLRHWLDNFEAKRKEILALGFDEPFIRLWRFYLTSCIASFESGRTDVMQVELRHA